MSTFFGKLKSGTVRQPVLIPPPWLIEQIVASHCFRQIMKLLAFVLCLTRAQQAATSPSVGPSLSKKDAAFLPQTPLEKLLSNAGPIREDGSDKFFGMENVCLRPAIRGIANIDARSLATHGAALVRQASLQL